MALSPSRRVYQGYTYTQSRAQNVAVGRSQRSPQISSPQLNAESEYHKLKNTSQQELKNKLQTVLIHNSELLNENGQLSQMVSTLKIQLSKKIEFQEIFISNKSRQVMDLMQTIKNNQLLHERELQRLLNEISKLHDQSYAIENSKNAQIKQLKQRYQREMASQTILIKKSHNEQKQIIDLHIKKYKETVQLRDYQIEAMKAQHKGQMEHLNNQISSLKLEIKHIQNLKQIQIKQLNNKSKEQITSTLKQLQREQQYQITQYETNMKKLKKQITNKTIQIQQRNKIAVSQEQDHQIQLLNIKAEKDKLLEEMKQQQLQYNRHLNIEKVRIAELSQMEKQNACNIKQSEKDILRAENDKLNMICLAKNNQIKRLFNNILQQKQNFKKDSEKYQNLINELRAKLKQNQLNTTEELELLKIKMAQLHQSDLKALQSYYENQISITLVQVRQLDQAYISSKQKVQHLLQGNDELRKHFQIQLSKQKARAQDLKVKLAALQAEHKQEITSLGTKMQLTSQTLIRQSDQKHKTQAFYEAQKRKFFQIIDGKDKQNKTLTETLLKIRTIHDEQKKQMEEMFNEFTKRLNEKEQQMSQFKKKVEEEFQKKKQQYKASSTKSIYDDLKTENQDLANKHQKVSAQLFAKLKQIEFLKKEVKSLQKELGLRAGFIETMQLQSQAAIEDQKSKLKILMNETQVSLKNYFEEKLSCREKQVHNLRNQLSEKESNIRDLIVKYNGLEKRLKSLLQAQQQLSDFQNKIVNLGVDQNLVKNLAQLFAKYKK